MIKKWLSSLLFFTFLTAQADQPITVMPLSLPDHDHVGSAGSFFVEPLAPQKVILFGDFGSGGVAQVNGEKVILKLQNSDNVPAKKIGDKIKVGYRNGNLQITYEGRVTGSCKVGGTLCEQSRGKLTFKRGKSEYARDVLEMLGSPTDFI